MSQFKVCIETIESVDAHPNADRLELARVVGMGYQFCIGKGEYKAGDRVIYIPIEAVLPDHIIDKLGVRNFLGGKDRNKVKTAILRGKVSQGIVCKVETLIDDDYTWAGMNLDKPGIDLAPALGITKYEPPVIEQDGVLLLPLPDGLSSYDIEGADRFLNIVALMMDEPVYITEKLEGYNESIVFDDPEPMICQHDKRIVREDPSVVNHFLDAANRGHLPALVRSLQAKVDAAGPLHLTVALRGELIGPGIIGNIYALQTQEVRMFDVKVGHLYMDAEPFEEAVPEKQRVPVVSKGKTLREWLAGRSLQDASNGMSLLNPKKKREGVVIRLMVERMMDFGDGSLSRVILKQRSPEYLAGEKD